MTFISNLFRRKPKASTPDFINPITTELHSHLIPGIDDGTETIEQSLIVLKEFANLGYKKVITTPHIMGDFYKNGPSNILPGLELVRTALRENNINIELHAAAEYMVDELLIDKIAKKELLTFGNNFVLIELPFTNEPSNFKNILFDLQMNGYQPVLAHPERYSYLAQNRMRFEELSDGGILLQLNLFSLLGYYSPGVQKTAEFLVDRKLVHLVGSDTHGLRHVPVFRDALKTAYYQKACNLPLLNNQL